jgi:hypothetical protein
MGFRPSAPSPGLRKAAACAHHRPGPGSPPSSPRAVVLCNSQQSRAEPATRIPAGSGGCLQRAGSQENKRELTSRAHSPPCNCPTWGGGGAVDGRPAKESRKELDRRRCCWSRLLWCVVVAVRWLIAGSPRRWPRTFVQRLARVSTAEVCRGGAPSSGARACARAV